MFWGFIWVGSSRVDLVDSSSLGRFRRFTLCRFRVFSPLFRIPRCRCKLCFLTVTLSTVYYSIDCQLPNNSYTLKGFIIFISVYFKFILTKLYTFPISSLAVLLASAGVMPLFYESKYCVVLSLY